MTDTTTRTDFPPETFGLHELSPKLLEPNPLNPRRELTDIDDLAKSIKQRGVLQALVAFPHGDKFRLEAGHRRLAASLKAGVATVPVIVKHPPAIGDQLADMLDENGQRADLTAIEEAQAYAALLEAGWSQSQVAVAVTKSTAHVSKRLALLKLPESVLDKVDAGTIPLDVAYDLTRITDPKVLKHLTSGGASPSKFSIDNAVAKQAREKAAERDAAKAAKDGLTVVALSQLANGTAALCAAAVNTYHLPTVHVIAMTAEAHAKTTCAAAVAVLPTLEAGKQRLAACLEPSAHKGVVAAKFGKEGWGYIDVAGVKSQAARNAERSKQAKSKASEPSQEAIDAERRAMFERFAAAATARRAATAKIIKSPGRRHLPLLHIGVITGAGAGPMRNTDRVACELLGIDVASTEWNAGATAINERLTDPAEDTGRIALALAAALIEARLFNAVVPWEALTKWEQAPHNWHDIDKEHSWEIGEYFTWLASNGYELDEVEHEVRGMCGIGEEPEGAASE